MEPDCDGRHPLELGAIQVNGESEEPTGEDRILAPSGERAIGTQERLLRHFLCTAPVPTEAVRQVDERRLPAADDRLEGSDVPGEDLLHIRLVFAGAHSDSSSTVRPTGVAVGCICYAPAPPRESATVPGSGQSYGMKRRESLQEVAMFESLPLFLFLSAGAVALFSFIAVASWSDARRREREAFYKSETLKKIAETQGTGATSALEILREEEKIAARRKIEGIKLGGLVTTAAGIGLIVLLVMLVHNEPVYAVGLIPLLVGAALLAYAYLLVPKA
jgi:hypothetical protein